MRQSCKVRKTAETEIKVDINLDGNGKYKIDTGIRFFNHMLEQFACHSGFDIDIYVNSLDKDNHHIVEDVAITLGEAFIEALGDKKGITRYGEKILPMDEALYREEYFLKLMLRLKMKKHLILKLLYCLISSRVLRRLQK